MLLSIGCCSEDVNCAGEDSYCFVWPTSWYKNFGFLILMWRIQLSKNLSVRKSIVYSSSYYVELELLKAFVKLAFI